MHEVTSPQAFEGLRLAKRKVRNPHSILATMDHCVPTKDRDLPIADPIAKKQIETMTFAVARFALPSHAQLRRYRYQKLMRQKHRALPYGYRHKPLPCPDGQSHVQAQTMLIQIDGELSKYASAKDIALAITGKIGTAGGNGHVIEYAGSAIRNLTMEGRMTLCNMAIEAGARAGLVAPDEKTYSYLKGREYCCYLVGYFCTLGYFCSNTEIFNTPVCA
jgi:3-isopropylmalate/(R)-2-methylmalate dehydratase large subunit